MLNDTDPCLTDPAGPLTEATHRYVGAATSDHTRRAYQSDLRDFQKKGGILPATPEALIAYLQQCAPHCNPRSLARRVTALRQWHRLQHHPDPTQTPAVLKTLRGIARIHGRPKRQARALRLAELDQLMRFLRKKDTLLAARDGALLLVGYFGALRRSELLGLAWSQLSFVGDGLVIRLPRSKTDPTGEGAQVVVPFGNPSRCPIQALLHWRTVSKTGAGPVFRRVVAHTRVGLKPITAEYAHRRIRALAKAAGLPQWAEYGSHSLRRGFATEAARCGAPLAAIQRHGRWQSTQTVLEYVEAGRQFQDSAVHVLFDFKKE